jgi:aprataxin
VEVLLAKAIVEGWLRQKAADNMLAGLSASVRVGKRTEKECVELVQSRLFHMKQQWENRKANTVQLCVADTAGTPAGITVYQRDWEGMKVQKFVQPPKPKQNEGLGALATLVQDPYARPERVLLLTTHCVVAYDLYPKARVHVLILPRYPIDGPQDLRPENEPLIRHMTELAQWLAPRLRAQFPGLPPLRCGFHAVPSMKHLHLHLISLDMRSVDLKRPRHWHIFNTDYLVAPQIWAQQLTSHGRVTVNVAAEKAKAKAAEMRCPLTGLILRDMGDLRNHLRSSAYLQQIDKIDADLVYISDLNGTLSS